MVSNGFIAAASAATIASGGPGAFGEAGSTRPNDEAQGRVAPHDERQPSIWHAVAHPGPRARAAKMPALCADRGLPGLCYLCDSASSRERD
jgi:hypothetical protein